ncbi:unnamed protein product [Brassica oleracea var. botrytis]|uniref:Uncharacterized protein n=3 Tax=Brassica TaxID=3705 RepID=A0A3P5ZKV7_BRACM|nr:unnamed protein product [Brassica napus]CAF2102970.1 unnamed protein product [Brassica napus]CAG7878266.1 unnamed protein product [Brassica rapa]VDC73190.1 unnamed protein product [Brassica rapa]VDD47220.1 unnamed protein product [Brassica oleracea]
MHTSCTDSLLSLNRKYILLPFSNEKTKNNTTHY